MARVTWQPAYLVSRKDETAEAVTLAFGVPEWPGHLPGQHVDVRLTAADGYSTQRSYSIATPDHGGSVDLTVQVVEDGEVSPVLARDLAIGDPVEIRGPIGGWFVWPPAQAGPVLLVGGGSGVVPLMAMVRARHEAGSAAPMHLVYSVRTPADVLYAAELERRARLDDGLRVTMVFTRSAPDASAGSAASARGVGRIRLDELGEWAFPVGSGAVTFVCGPTGFVDAVANSLVDLGHDEHSIKTERFGPSGG